MSLAKRGRDLTLNDKSNLSNYGIKGLWFNGKHMHFETIERGFNIYMEKSMEPNCREGVFNLKPSRGQDGAFNRVLVWCLREVYALVLEVHEIYLE